MSERLILLNGALAVSAGINRFDAPHHVAAALRPGVKVVVLLSGRMQIGLDGGMVQDVCGPASVVIRSRKPAARDQVYAPEVPIRYALVQMEETLLDPPLAAMLDHTHGETCGDRPLLLTTCADTTQQSLARQLMNCPFAGPERNLYLGGKALQLAAMTLTRCLSESAPAADVALSSSDIAKIRAARAILIAALQEPPPLAALARQVGLNVRKLNSGFRRVFGATAYGFLQEYRLEHAYKLLTGGETSVSEAAYQVGYRPTHFATIFRKRFGVPPSEIG
jgi:AraC family transcriptional activator of pyochelin receptor